jgi:cyclase
MLQKRIIPVLLLKNQDLVHRIMFSHINETYIGDPINCVNIFNQYEIDEMIVLDIKKSLKDESIDFNFLSRISGEAFFPMSYGGGITSVESAECIIKSGFEKIIINSQNFQNLELAKRCVDRIGSQSVIANIDIKKINDQYFVYNHINNSLLDISPEVFIESLINAGVGEICLTSVNVDGTMNGPDLRLIENFSHLFEIPFIYKGGGSCYLDIKKVFKTNISAYASSSIFIMKKLNGGIVLNYTSPRERNDLND